MLAFTFAGLPRRLTLSLLVRLCCRSGSSLSSTKFDISLVLFFVHVLRLNFGLDFLFRERFVKVLLFLKE